LLVVDNTSVSNPFSTAVEKRQLYRIYNYPNHKAILWWMHLKMEMRENVFFLNSFLIVQII